jgi:amidase
MLLLARQSKGGFETMDLAYSPAVELTAKLRAREIGCLELLDHHLARVERFNSKLNAIVVLDPERARARARVADDALAKGETWGPLHGLPMTIKEAIDVADLPTTWGMPEHRDNRPARNALVVDRLLEAGAIIFGKTNVPFRLTDWQTFNDLYGTTNNPWDLSRAPGGSSGGAAAALATGMAALEIGSDIGGSIRNPAHFCGVCGHKPSYGLVPQEGHWLPDNIAPPDINVLGPMARSVADLEETLSVVAGPSSADAVAWRLELPPPRRQALKDFRIAVMLEDPNCAVDRSITDRIQSIGAQLSGLGATVSDKARPDVDTVRGFQLFLQLLRAITTSVLPEEAYEQAKRDAAALAPDDDSYFARITRAAVQPYRGWFAANEERWQMRARFAEFFESWDVLLCPVAARPAFPHDQKRARPDRTIEVNGRLESYNDQLFWAGLFGILGLPATVVPMGPSPSGLPVGLQIVGPYLQDRTTLEFARLLEREIGGFVPPPGYD